MEVKILWEDSNQKIKINKIVLVEIIFIVWNNQIINKDKKEKKLLKEIQEKVSKRYEFILNL